MLILKKIFIITLLILLPSIYGDSSIITIGTGEWRPYISKELTNYGPISQIVKRSFEEVNLTIEFQFKPWKRLLHESIIEEMDAISVWGGYSWADTHLGSDPIFEGKFVLWMRSGELKDWESLEELKGLTLGAIRGEKVPENLKSAYEKGYIKFHEITSYKNALKMLLLRRIDMIAINYNSCSSTLKKYFSKEEQEQIGYHPKPLRTSYYRVIFPKSKSNSKLLLEKFNKGLSIIKESGEVDNILNSINY